MLMLMFLFLFFGSGWFVLLIGMMGSILARFVYKCGSIQDEQGLVYR